MSNKKLIIAIQGVKGAFHEEAAQQFFGENIEIEACITFSELVQKLVDGKVDKAVMAIENTISGTIHDNYELIRKNDLFIIGEVYLRIKQNLAVVKGATLDTLETVSSHYMALNQSREFFKQFPTIQLVESDDTALSIKQVAERGSIKHGAVGSQLAIEHYGLEMLAESIETSKMNYTRFAILSKKKMELREANKVSLSVVLAHESGTLSQVLSLLHLLGVNLTKIESSPILGEPFQYRFYIDFILGEKVGFELLIETLQSLITELVILGKYKSENTIK